MCFVNEKIMEKICVFYVLWCFIGVVSVLGNSLKDPYICGPPSCTPSNKFKYSPNVVYHYDYTVNVNTWFAESSNNQSTLDIKTNVTIQFVSPCEGLLQLHNVTLVDQDESYPIERAENFVHALSVHELRFAFHEGVISEICPEVGEDVWVLNFKRGLLSLLQNTMKRFDINYKGLERDVHGTCTADYTVRGQAGTSLQVIKLRDLSQCTDRYKYKSILQTVRYDFQSKFQTWPVLKSESKCRITIDHNIYSEVNCAERHLFSPFSGHNSGAMTTVVQNLRLVEETNKTQSQLVDEQPKTWNEITSRASLLYQASPHDHPVASTDLKSVRDLLKMLCNSPDSSDPLDSTNAEANLQEGALVSVWTQLVRRARLLSHAPLSQLLTRANTICGDATKYLLDALPYIASPASVEIIKEMLVKKSVDNNTREEWLLSMAMIPRPHAQMLESMLELVQKQPNDKAVSFSASSMLHSYCKHSGKSLRECCEEEVPAKILAEFENIVNQIIADGVLKASREVRDNLQVAIKSLGNIGGFDQKFADILINLISEATLPIPVRLTAIDAFRKTPCLETREYFLEMYREDFVEVEIRIASYLQVMRCPTLSTVRKIFHSLKNEPINQVATFVWSHLNNLGKSSLPSRVEIQGLLSGNTLPQLEDEPDFRMFSRNYEQSVFFDQYNAGGNYEANVIFSPDSYIPRSMSLNLTIDMFGESINMLEIKTRIEGFERYFESIFGNNGPLSKTKLNDEIQNLRFLRSTNDADELRAKIDSLNYKNEALRHQFPLAELGVKVFGNEISFWSLEGDVEIRNAMSKLNPKLWLMELLSGKAISYNKASLFLDTTFSVPTGSGLPLSLNLMGTNYVNLKIAGALDKEFEGNVNPSVAVNIAATMGVIGGPFTSTGIRLNMRLYTSTAVKAKLKIDALKELRLELSLPRPKQQIFAAKSELIILHGDQELQQQGLNKNRIEQNTCSWSTFDQAVGIKVCASYQFPNMTNIRNAPYFLMSGPSKYILSLEKADPTANTYLLHYKWDENATSNLFNFSFNTPDSKEKRMISAIVSLSQNTSTASLSLQSSKTIVLAKALYRNIEYDKCIEASLLMNGHKHFDTVMSFTRHDIKHGYVWLPHAYWLINDERIAELTGSLKSKTKGGVTQWDIATEFQTKQLASRLNGYYTINGPTHGTKLQLDYQFYKNAKQTIKVEGLYSERAAGYRHDLYGELAMEFTAYPVYNFYSIFRNVKTISHVDIGLNISRSREHKDDPNFIFSFMRVEKLNGMKMDTQLMVARPKPVRMRFKFEEVGSKYNALVQLNFNPKSRDIIVSGYLYYPPGTQLYMDCELNTTLPTLHPSVVKAKLHEKMAHEYQLNANGIWFTGTDFNIDALYQDQSKTNMASHRLKVLINSSHFKDIAVDARFTQDNRQITFIGQGEYHEDSYRALIRHIVLSEMNFTTYVEFDVGEKAYSADLSADLSNNTNVNVDLHFDQLQDVHISYQRWSTDAQKRLSAAINWDANRDPNQKISVDMQLDHKGGWDYAGHATLYYPGNAINADMEFLAKNWFCEYHIGLGWSPQDVILWRVKMFSEVKNQTIYALLSKLDTPFNGWRDTSCNLMWRYQNNMQALNGSMSWQEDYLTFSLLADYAFKSNALSAELVAAVNSSIATLPRATAIARHRHVWPTSHDTTLSFRYNDDGKLMINSSWSLDRGPNENNVTGKVTLITPFPGYKKGFLRTKFIFGNKRDIDGVTYLDLEDKVLKVYVKGHMRRITNCMLVINATSPVTSLTHLTARFGFVENDRHLVAMVVTPTSTTGVEILLKLGSVQDFNVFGHIALPIQYLNRAMLTAKRAAEELDFRVGWGTMDLGFTGIWQYRSPINFVYVYKLFTPLEGFEENGCVLKNLYGPGLDTEISVRLSTHKFGIALLLQDNGKGLLDVIKDKFQHKKTNSDIFIENFDTKARVILDTLYYPTVTFEAHLMKFVGADEEDILNVNATLNLPAKPPICLTDVFILEEYTVMRNTLHLTTPFPVIKELKSEYTVDIVMGEKFNITCVNMLSNGSHWHEISYKVYYEYESGDDDAYQSHQTSLHIITPLDVLPELQSAVSVRLEDALWKLSGDVSMDSFSITAQGTIELDDPFVETSGSLNLTSPYLQDYFIKMEFRKDFSDLENVLGGGIQVQQGEQNNYLFADCVWRPKPHQSVKFKSRAALYPVLKPSEVLLVYSHDEDVTLKVITGDLNIGDDAYSLKAELRNSTSVAVTISTAFERMRTAKLLCEFENEDIHGSFVTDTLEYGITGKVINREPFELSLNLVPKGQGETLSIRIKGEFTPTIYGLSAQVMGPLQLTVLSRLEVEKNFTDVNFKVDIPQRRGRDIFIKARLDASPGLRRTLSVQAATPLRRLTHVKGNADFEFGPKTGYVLCDYDMPDMKGDGDLKWSFLVGDLFIKALGHQHVEKSVRSVDLDIFFGNTTADGFEKNNAGFRMDLDQIWQIGANASFGYILDRRLSLLVNAVLPKPNVDVHTLVLEGGLDNMYWGHAVYTTDVTNVTAGVKATVLPTPDNFETNSTIHWTSASALKSIENKLKYSLENNVSHTIQYELSSPLYINDTTFTLDAAYQNEMVHGLKIVKGTMHRGSSSCIGLWDVRYGGIEHTDGHFNLTTPFQRLPWLRSVFRINNSEEQSTNKIDLYWPNKTATINTTNFYTQNEDGFTQTGDISVSIPLNTQHLVQTNYYYLQKEKTSNGNATIDFDRENFVKASFRQILEKSQRNLDLTTTDIEVENVHTPVGIKYVHEFDSTGHIDVKEATVFHLQNVTKFNVSGKIDVFSYDTGKTLKLTATHGQRTLTFENLYEAIDKELKQGSKIKWAEDVWVNYDIHVTNMTTNDKESQQLILNVWYPLRTFNLIAQYNLWDTLLDGKAKLHWNVKDENKTAELNGRWENPPDKEKNMHLIDLSLAHPSFRKDVTLKGLYISTPSVMSNISVELQYSDYENEYLKLKSILTDNSNGPIRDYKFELKCLHPATNLDLEMKSDINVHSKWYYLDNYYRFQKSLFHEKLRHLKFVADLDNSFVQYERVNETYFYKLNSTWMAAYPIYRVVGNALRPTGNDTAFAELRIHNKSLSAHYNATDDVSYHLIGAIIDTRSAILNAWRDFDDVTTVDLASYIRLNHSRLLTSKVAWRPEMFADIKSTALSSLRLVYNHLNDTLTIIKEAPMEGHMALKNIWMDARPRIKEFLDDLYDLHVIKDDWDDFERFLNTSYNGNDFYLKDIVEFTYYVLDEMALKNHLESLPGIVNDMWGMMGNTSQSIKQSLTYVVDTIKKAYANFIVSTNKFLESDFMELVSDKLESMIMQYDNFVRDLHLKLLEYWEQTYVNASDRLTKYGHELMKSLEPLFFKVVHYTEAFVSSLVRNIMDFFNNRTRELTDSPYFNYVSTFGHEMDKIYKDLVSNDLVTNIKKYSQKLANAIWTKIEEYIPFKDEILSLYHEFKGAWEKFLQTPQVVYVREKYQEAYDRLKWWYDYFLIGEATERVWDIIYDKLIEVTRTALQYEEEHRTPKTNFIFDPRKGEILLEQKLPMSWHAFNRTPDFSEIAEYKFVRDIMDDWLFTNKSIWSYYYEIRPYMDINNVLPPFAGMAMMTGQGTLITFDKRVMTISSAGTFLLCKDYRQNNFTVLIESNQLNRYDLLLLTKKNVIKIDLYQEVVWVGSSRVTLPHLVDGYLAERQRNLLTLQAASGVLVQCNFIYKTCKIMLPGWYFASLGGLLGTYNNEQSDDLQLPNGTVTASLTTLSEAWRLRGSDVVMETQNKEFTNSTHCAKLFNNKVSPLKMCFSVIDATPLYTECMSGIDPCALANTYIELCSQQHIPIHTPEQCNQCTTPQGDIIEEGSPYTPEFVPNSTDIVFIVEAHACNSNIRKNKNIDLFIEAFDTQLQSSGLTDIRYAIVAFGGSNIYSKPRSLYVDEKVYRSSIEIPAHFDNLKFDSKELRRNNRTVVDMFAAISFATTLPSRPGVPTALILMPCSKCDAGFMRLDYSTIYQNLMESSATLHIMMDDDFVLMKRRAAKYLFGVDSTLAYTNKDYEKLVGDAALCKQVKLPKEKLGLCGSLALESNGSVWAGRKLSRDRGSARRFAVVAARRIREGCEPCTAVCECASTRLVCPRCRPNRPHQMELFWNVDDIEDMLDLAMDNPTLPSLR